MAEFVPHSYQERAIQNVTSDPFHALFMDPGLGKTSIILQTLLELRRGLDVSRALVVAPLRVCYMVWPEEITKWEQFKDTRVSFIHGGPEAMAEAIEEDADLYLINPEGLRWLFGQKNKKRSSWRPGPWRNWKRRPEMLVIDELTRFKRSTGLRSKTLKRYLKDFGRRVGMTGTPAPNGLLDLHGQMLIIDRGAALDWRITHYKKRFFVQVGEHRDNKWSPRAGSEEEIVRLIAPHVTSLDAGDYLDLPKRIVTEVPVRLPDPVKVLYKQMQADGCIEFPDGTEVLTASDSSVGKCQQIANGTIYTSKPWETHKKWKWVHTQKLEALQELIEEIGRPVIVAYEFLPDAEVIQKGLPSVKVIGGRTSLAESKRVADQWNAGDLPVLLTHPASGGVGLNLQYGGNSIIWYAPPWDLEHFEQLVRRLERQGQLEPNVFVYFLVARGTIDTRICRVLKSKEATQTALKDALREEF
ncbi:MAG: DEAD/DEAH box helicase [Gemmatimonadota bacterium]